MRQPRTIMTVLSIAFMLFLGLYAKAQHYVPIDGAISDTVTLSKLGGDTAYLVNEALLVTENGALNIESGVTIYFGQSAYMRIDGGKLNMEGRRSDTIYLLCYEFTHDWAGIQLKNINDSQNVNINYIKAIGANPAISASTSSGANIRHSSFYNYYAGKGIELSDCNNFTVDSCHFSQCISGIELRATEGDSQGNRFTNNIFDQGQINISVSNVNYGRKCRDNHISGNCFQDAATAIYFESVGGVLYNEGKNYITGNLISSRLPEGNPNYASYGIKAAMDSLVISNNVFWRNDEAITMLRNCHLIVRQNTFYENKKVITNLLPMSSVSFNNNTVSEASETIMRFANGNVEAHTNNLMHPTNGALLFENACANDISLRRNYWSTHDASAIEAMLIDQYDNPDLGILDYADFLITPDTVAPLSPPHCVKRQFIDGFWRISWDENPEADLDHYILLYGDFNHYKFSYHSNPIYGNSCTMPSQSVENIAVMACEQYYDSDAYAHPGKSAVAFASYYPFAGHDDHLCAPETGFYIKTANIPYTYNSFIWHTSGTGFFSDPLSLRPIYYPSAEDFNTGEVTLTLRVAYGAEVKTDDFTLTLHKQLRVHAGDDDFYGLLDPITLHDATAHNFDSIRWHSLGDGNFDDPLLLNPTYSLGEHDIELRQVSLVLEGWSFCEHISDTVSFDLYETFTLEGTTWSGGTVREGTLIVAAAVRNTNPFTHEFYRTISDEDGHFIFTRLLPNTYILYALPDTINHTISGSYYLGELQWNESNMIIVDGNTYDVDIVLPPIPDGFHVGEGSICGVFELPGSQFGASDFYCASWLREGDSLQFCDGGLSNVGIVLMNATKQRILGFTLTDAQGRFKFDHLPFGTYHIMADIPRFGRGIDAAVTLTSQTPEVQDLHLYLDGKGHVALYKHSGALYNDALSLYPNPGEDRISLSGLDALQHYTLHIVNHLGMNTTHTEAHADLGGEIAIDITPLSQGIYTIHIVSETTNRTVKFTKR